RIVVAKKTTQTRETGRRRIGLPSFRMWLRLESKRPGFVPRAQKLVTRLSAISQVADGDKREKKPLLLFLLPQNFACENGPAGSAGGKPFSTTRRTGSAADKAKWGAEPFAPDS